MDGIVNKLSNRRELLLGSIAIISIGLHATQCKRTAQDAQVRCAFCGMRIAADSHWQAGAQGESGQALHFDTPGCLHRYRLQTPARVVTAPWVIEYYGTAQVHRDATSVRYVVGSTVTGPMGADLIPVNESAVARFRTDHSGSRVLRYEEINAQVLREL